MSKFTVLDDFNFAPESHVGKSGNQTLKGFSPKKQVQRDISRMFANFIMVKTNEHEIYSVYKAKVECMLCVGGTRYIVAITTNDTTPIGTKVPLEDIDWIVFQTRYTDDYTELKNVIIPAKEYTELSDSSLNDKITKWLEVSQTEHVQAKSLYRPENLPLTIEIIHMKESDSFAQKGTILSALKLFQTILIFED